MKKSQPSGEPQKIVVQFGERSVKGFLESPGWMPQAFASGAARNGALENLRIRHLDSGKVEEIPIGNVKAVFYVRSFEGDPGHANLNFYSRAPIADGIWMRVEFRDGEVMEGLVLNSLQYLVEPGFFILPTSPDSNNELVYVLKSWLADHRVLGLRPVRQLSRLHPVSAAGSSEGMSLPG